MLGQLEYTLFYKNNLITYKNIKSQFVSKTKNILYAEIVLNFQRGLPRYISRILSSCLPACVPACLPAV